MRKTLSLVVLAAVCCLGLGSAAAAPKVDLFGYYYLDPAPKGFQDISELHLSTIDFQGEKMAKVPLHGWIRLKPAKGKGPESAVDFPLVSPTLKGRALTFTTREVAGVSYRFAGSFVRLGNFPEERPEGEAILKGHLSRLKGGKVIAESDVGFLYTAGD
jgi:hypothetical protein